MIYTPGSSAGIPVSILKSFAAPPPEILEDGELFQERITTTVTSLLGLLNIQADPLQSREHILMSTIIGQMWRKGQDFDPGKPDQPDPKPTHHPDWRARPGDVLSIQGTLWAGDGSE